MSWRYSCPRCKAALNPKDYIILLGNPSGEEQRMLVGFHPQPGNYEVHFPPGTTLEPGARWDFCCPVCREGLGTDDDKLCAVELTEEGEKRQVLFSRIANEQATFIVSDHGVTEQFGEAAREYARHLVHLKYLR